MLRKIVFGISLVLSTLFIVLIVVTVIALRSVGDDRVEIYPETLLELNLAQVTQDYDVGSLHTALTGDVVTVNNLLSGIDRAASDERISGILLQCELLQLSWASLREVRESLLAFRRSGKPIYTHLTVAADKGYYLASVADQLWLTEAASGGIMLRGLGFERAYLKKLLNACGLDFEVVHAGRYKGAFEHLSRDNMSAAVRDNLTSLLEDISVSYTEEITRARGLTPGLLLALLQERKSLLLHGEQAVELGLVDRLMSQVEVEQWLGERWSDEQRLSCRDYITATQRYYLHGNIAVLYLEGVISESTLLSDPTGSRIDAATFLPLLTELSRDDDVAAVVMRINSPGGSAAVSEEIWQGARQLAAAKPLIVSLGGVAASGGYYIACAGEQLLAQPTTITGSIGVVGMLLDATQLLDRGRVNYEEVSTSPYHSFGHPAFSLTRREKAMLQEVMAEVYDQFKQRVASGRSLSMEQVEEIAQGQVWSGNQAVELGLVDGIGTLEDAIRAAASAAGLHPEEVRITSYPRQKGLLQLLMEFDPSGIILPEVATGVVELIEEPQKVNLLSELLQARLLWELE